VQIFNVNLPTTYASSSTSGKYSDVENNVSCFHPYN
jgi:hypothetical protein